MFAIDRARPGRSDGSVSPVVPHFELAEDSPDASAHVITVRGEIHVSTAPQFAKRLTNAIESGRIAIVLDLCELEFIDSTGLSVILSGLRLINQKQGRMAIACANPTVMRLFQITSLVDTFDIFPDRATAIAHVAGGSSGGAP
ncbi:MAG: anti-sigma factor antagonist [Solirubrobacteraceae bacterium]|nr:anti-sigma factor antagonist [Solirubrobacteraceae bacterium]MEA2186104.1 anti-sigma factor antagonist [Solirubrobacteraceae bacterium]